MRRRHFYHIFGALLGSAPLRSFGQSKGKPIIGVLVPVGEDGARHELTALRQGLTNYGLVDGDTIQVLVRYADNKVERLTDLARDLKAQGSQMIVASGTTTVEAAQHGAPDLPIVMAGSADPVVLGLAKSLARPGGRITGISIMGEGILGKNLQLLKELLHTAGTFAAFLQASNPGNPAFRKAFDNIGHALGVRINIVEIADPVAEFPGAFERAVQQSAVGALILADPLFFTHRKTIFRLALDHRLPTVGPNSEYAKAGSLLAYSWDVVDIWRQSARYISEILRGADPATLPIEEPTAFHFAINVRTARTLGIEIPPTILARADEVIE
jgi:putative ABC transport system substrate-binding protein